jgi:SulP family sulfate permease
VLDRIADQHKAFVLDFAAVPFIDSTAANTIEGIARKTHRQNGLLLISSASPAIRKTLAAHGIKAPAVPFEPSIAAALETAHAEIAHKAAAHAALLA